MSYEKADNSRVDHRYSDFRNVLHFTAILMKNKEAKSELLVKKFWDVTFDFSLFDHGKKRAVQCATMEVESIVDLDIVWYDKDCEIDGKKVNSDQTLEYWEEILNELKSMK